MSFGQFYTIPDCVGNFEKQHPYDFRNMRIFVEKVYFDLFHKEKGFKWDLLKYLQKDGETVILPEIPSRVITSKK